MPNSDKTIVTLYAILGTLRDEAQRLMADENLASLVQAGSIEAEALDSRLMHYAAYTESMLAHARGVILDQQPHDTPPWDPDQPKLPGVL